MGPVSYAPPHSQTEYSDTSSSEDEDGRDANGQALPDSPLSAMRKGVSELAGSLSRTRRKSIDLDVPFMHLQKEVNECNELLVLLGCNAIELAPIRFHNLSGGIEYKVHAIQRDASVSVLLDTDDLDDIYSVSMGRVQSVRSCACACRARASCRSFTEIHHPRHRPPLTICHSPSPPPPPAPTLLKILTGESRDLRHAFETGGYHRVDSYHQPIHVILDGHCPLVGKALVKMGRAAGEASNPTDLSTDDEATERAKELMLADEAFQKPTRAPLMAALPPHQTLKGDIFVSMFVACEEPEWNKSWDDLVGRSITVTVKLTQLETLPFKADRCYCQYQIGDDLCTTDMDAMGEIASRGPVDLNHIGMHVVHNTSAKLLTSMASGELEVEIYASPCVADDLEAQGYVLDTNNLPLRRRYGFDLPAPASPRGDGATCAECGNEYMADSHFCRNCGAKRNLSSTIGLSPTNSNYNMRKLSTASWGQELRDADPMFGGDDDWGPPSAPITPSEGGGAPGGQVFCKEPASS